MKRQPKKKKVDPFAKQELPIPFQSLVGHTVTKPILSVELKKRVDASIIPYKRKLRWEQWGMHKIKKAGTAILLTGPSGTGKTTIARYLAKEVSPGIIEVTMGDLGGGDPGDTERNIKRVFEKGREENNCTIFVDECDSILWSRDKAGPDSMWMLSVVNGMMMQIEKYPGLVALATNHAHYLDPALKRRISDAIEIPLPEFDVRRELWYQKIPSEFPYQPEEVELNALAKIPKLTGADIENIIIECGKMCMIEGRKPTFAIMQRTAKEYTP